MLVVVHTHNEALLIKRVDHNNFWQSITGSVEWQESALTAALRELKEETGITGVSLRATGISRRFKILEAWKPRYHPEVRFNTETVFYCALPERCAIKLDPAEHDDYQWLPFKQAQQFVSSWTNRLSILALS